MGLIRRVAIDLTPMLPGGANGGAKIFVLNLIRELAQLAPERELVLLTHAETRDELAQLELANTRLVLMPSVQHRKTSTVWSIGRAVGRYLPPVLKSSIAGAGTRYLDRAPRRLIDELGHELLFCPFTTPTFHADGIPTVCTLYDLQHREFPQFFERGDRKHREQSFLDAARDACALASISEYSRQAAIAAASIEPERIVTIPLRLARRVPAIGVETARTTLAGFGLDYGWFLLYPANFWPHKNHEALLHAFAAARGRGLAPTFKLVLSGSADARQQVVRDLARVLDLQDDVVLPGFVTPHEFEALLAGCSAVIFPSLFEGFGLPVIEAMSAGRPVGCSRVASLPEVAGDAALMFNPRDVGEIADSILRLTSDEPLRKRLIAAGRKRASAYSDSRQTAREYWMLFEEARRKTRACN